MESSLYEGVVGHARLQPVKHGFRYRLYMYFLDLDEVPFLMRTGSISGSRCAARGFLRGDHFGDRATPLAESVRELVQAQTGMHLAGPIRLLTQLRTFGYYFSPLNLFYCYETDGRTIRAVVAEVQNTPWLERHCYILWEGNRQESGDRSCYRHRKSFHVSPFLGMDMEYSWRAGPPGDRLDVNIENWNRAGLLFQVSMQLRRQTLSRATLRRVQIRHPLMTARITAAIYFQALRLWRKRCRFHPHPRLKPESAMPPQQPPLNLNLAQLGVSER